MKYTLTVKWLIDFGVAGLRCSIAALSFGILFKGLYILILKYQKASSFTVKPSIESAHECSH